MQNISQLWRDAIIKPQSKNLTSETMFAGKRLKDYTKKQLMEFLETYIKA